MEMEKSSSSRIANTKYNIKQSPHYEEQKEEIELLNQITS